MKRLSSEYRACRYHLGKFCGTPPFRSTLALERRFGACDVLVILLSCLCNLPAGAQSTLQGASRQQPRATVAIPVILSQAPVGASAAHARLVLLATDGTTRVLTPGFASASDPDLSADGQHIVFAGKRTPEEHWNVFELDLGKLTTRQITRDSGDCRSPLYTSSFYTITEKAPWEQIAFLSTRARQADERRGGPAPSLYTCKLDGTYLQRITYNMASDLDPTIMADGRLVYSSWQRATLDHGLSGRLAIDAINTDGSDRLPVVSAFDAPFARMPCVTSDGLLVFVEVSSADGEEAGRLSRVSLRRPLHTYRAISRPGDGLYRSPSPLPDGRILVSWKPSDGSASFGLYRLDPATGKRELVYDDPDRDELQTRAVYARPRPDGRSSTISIDDPTAKLYCVSIFINDFKDRTWLSPGSVQSLRVVEGVPGRLGGPSDPSASRARDRLSARRVLLEMPVKPDGSFQVIVPANTPIELQLLDDHGMAVRSCGWIWARNHQAQGCIGCHEDPEQTPPNRFADALKEDPGMAAVPVERRTAVDFALQVAPVILSKCVFCHCGREAAAAIDLTGDDPVVTGPAGGKIDQLYEKLLASAQTAGEDSGSGKYIHPGRARTSPLVWHILGRNTSRPWDKAAADGSVKPIPPGKSEPLTDLEKQTIIRWIDLGARRIAVPDVHSKAEVRP